jgi:dTMP kinase
MKRGCFISVEGGEGAGKSTQIARVAQFLRDAGVPVHLTREPGGTPLAEEIRELLLRPRVEPVCERTELLLMFAARAQHVQTLIRPALERGEWVVCDRFADATLAYQGAGRGLDRALIGALRTLVLGEFAPELTLLLDVPVDCGMSRVGSRGEHDRFEGESRAFHERVRACYLELARAEPARFRVIDASAPCDAVSVAVLHEIEGLLDRVRGH